MNKHPMQPVQICDDGVARFQPNAIVRFLVDWAAPRGMSLNDLAILPFDKEDRSQLAQLIGYSVSGFGDLSYADSEHVQAADDAAEKLLHALPAPAKRKGRK
jgi:hypothetical protein